MEKLFIGIDIGGMSAKAGLVTLDGKILSKLTAKTDASMDEAVFLPLIKNLVLDLIKQAGVSLSDIGGIGMGFPGSIDDEAGVIRYCCNLNLRNAPFAVNLKKALGFDGEVKLSNDANIAALAEAKFGAAKGMKDVVLITIGTGIGTGIISGGKMITGNRSAGAEGGHMTIVAGGELCGCGRRGCFESYASTTALLKMAKEAAETNKESMLYNEVKAGTLTGKTFFECLDKGDAIAKEVMERYITYLGEGVVNYANIFYPEAIILGGGVSAQGDKLTVPVQKYLNEHVYGKEYNPPIKVVAATLGNDAGIIGGAALFFD
ncbi:MAG: ROK family protein [Clostridiales bacterium]|nr:ROK family protein [Clostridiales bacterium]